MIRVSPRNLAAYTLLPLAIVGFAVAASATVTTWVLETWWCPLINGPED